MQHQQQDRSHTHEAEHAHQHQQQDHTQQDRSRTQKQPGGAQPHRTKQPRPSNAPLGTGMGDGMCQSDCSLARAQRVAQCVQRRFHQRYAPLGVQRARDAILRFALRFQCSNLNSNRYVFF